MSTLKRFANTELQPHFAPNRAHHLPLLSAPSQRLICRARSANTSVQFSKLEQYAPLFHQTKIFLVKYDLLPQTQERKSNQKYSRP